MKMNKINKYFPLVLFLLCMQMVKAQIPSPKYEVRAVWLTTLMNLDWPKRAATTAEGEARQRADLVQMLDELQQCGVNTVVMQARVRSTTIYPSKIEPWDACMTGKAGRAPGYDPLAFAIEECHKRNMELHAWVVCFPICKLPAAKQLGNAALPKKRPELCQLCGDQWMMDPGVPGTAEYIASICREIVENYDVDGISLDYIRYPESSIPFNDNKTYQKYGYGKNRNQWRSENVTRTVRLIHDAVRSVKPWVKLSCSPVGKYCDLPLHSSKGWNARDAVHQDAVAWLNDGLMDMLMPMMYFTGDHFYPFAVDWQQRANGKPIVPGLGIYFLNKNEKNWDLDVITREMNFIRWLGMGQAYFRTQFLLNNEKGLYDYCKDNFYSRSARIPPMTWVSNKLPATPQLSVMQNKWDIRLSWDAQPEAVHYNVYRSDVLSDQLDSAQILAENLKTTGFTYLPALPEKLRGCFAVTAVDRYGNESKPAVVSTLRKKIENNKRLGMAEVGGVLEVGNVDAEELVVLDMSGREVLRHPNDIRLYLYGIARGCYELRAIDSQRRMHPLKLFWKK